MRKRKPYDRFRHHRRSLRLRSYDYRRAAAYFVTIRAAEAGDVFGWIEGGSMILNDLGAIVNLCWSGIQEHFPGVRLDAWIVMPDHFHGIILLPHGVPDNRNGVTQQRGRQWVQQRAQPGAQHAAPLEENGLGDASARDTVTGNPDLIVPGSLSCIVRSFKSASTRQINLSRDTPGAAVWQRNFYERIIRDRQEIESCRRYIGNNPRSQNRRPELEPL